MSLLDVVRGKSVDVMTQQYVGSLVRASLIGLGVVTAKSVDNGQVEQIAGALMALASVAWSLYQKRQNRAVLMVPLAAAGMTENTAKAMVANPAIQTPDVATHPDSIPTLTLSEVERNLNG